MRADRRLHALPGSGHPLERAVDYLVQMAEAFAVHADEQVLLRAEVVVHRAGQDAGGGADLAQRCALVTLCAEDLRRGGDQLLAPRMPGGAARVGACGDAAADRGPTQARTLRLGQRAAPLQPVIA